MRVHFAILFSLLLTPGGACSVLIRTVPTIPAESVPIEPGVFSAGAAQVDITPPVGLPRGGYGPATEAWGVGQRLWATSVVMDDGRGSRIAIVVVDLVQLGGLLVDDVVSLLSPRSGLGTDNLMIVATHNHAGPGGFLGDSIYNERQSSSAGYDPLFAAWLAQRIAISLTEASDRLRPALMASFETDDQQPVISRNRSIAAWRLNHRIDAASVDNRLRGFVITDLDHSLIYAMTTAHVHGAALAKTYPYYHADFFGVAAHTLASIITKSQPSAVVVVAPGPAGDQDPAVPERARTDTELVKLIEPWAAAAAVQIMATIPQATAPVRVERAARDIYLPEARARGDAARSIPDASMCALPVYGVSVMAGSEAGRPWFARYFREGLRARTPLVCQGGKPYFPAILQDWFMGHKFPRYVSISAFRIDGVATFLSVPGEPTLETGYLIEAQCKGLGSHCPSPFVFPTTNGYAGYIATAAEYDRQEYEGASTIYGPQSAQFYANSLSDLAASLGAHSRSRIRTTRTSTPGRVAERFLVGTRVTPVDAGAPVVNGRAVVETTNRGMIMWPYPRLEGWCGEVLVADERRGGPKTRAGGIEFVIERTPRSAWRLTWSPDARVIRGRQCELRVGTDRQLEARRSDAN